MFEFTATIHIQTNLEKLWEYLVDIETWWLPSNPDHIELDILSEQNVLRVGTEILIREKIAGIPGEAVGTIEAIHEHDRITWSSNAARYAFYGISLNIREGVTWQLEKIQHGTKLSAHVWAQFPRSLFGRMVEWIFRNILNGVEKDYEHAMTELRYIKEQVEAQS